MNGPDRDSSRALGGRAGLGGEIRRSHWTHGKPRSRILLRLRKLRCLFRFLSHSYEWELTNEENCCPGGYMPGPYVRGGVCAGRGEETQRREIDGNLGLHVAR